tara:strand:+ start:2298 stop:3239 length:942 start_codon:yes stop_codon:yes gene_type:complete
MKIIKIGKSKSNDIHNDFVNDATVSRVHCQIFIDDDGNIFLTDLNSTNGTFVNGNKIHGSVQLSKYDIVRAGNSLVRWKEHLMNYEKKDESKDEQNFETDKPNQPISKNYFWILLILIIIISLIQIGYNKIDQKSINYEDNRNEKSTNVDNEESNENYIPPIKTPIIYPTSRPSNGYSPYDSYYGKGIYNNSTDNTIKVTAPLSQDIVIMIKDIYSSKTIRNEYIRAGTTFSLTGIPYGTYKFIYLYGNDWSANANFKSGSTKGNFLTNKGVGKSNKFYDVDFKVGYYGTYSLTLQLLSNGNLTTVEGTEDDL